MDPKAKLRLRCRTGLRELDLVLGRFLDAHYDDLDAEGREAFERLVACGDQDLLDWLFGRSVPDDPALAALVERLRTAR